MIEVERITTAGWEPALRGMRNPLNSWDRGDSSFAQVKWLSGAPTLIYELGPNDRSLMERLIHAGGNEHCKFRRMLTIWADIVAPLYWWKQMDTYKVGTVENSCSTMHTLAKKPITIDMFSTDGLLKGDLEVLEPYIAYLEASRQRCAKKMDYAKEYRETNPELSHTHHEQAKSYWNALIKMLPESFNQRRTISLNYEVMAAIYRQRKNHKLQEWHDFIGAMLDLLPEPWIFTEEGADDE